MAEFVISPATDNRRYQNDRVHGDPYINVNHSYDNAKLTDIDEKPEEIYEEINDYQVYLPPLRSKLSQRPNRSSGDPVDPDYHDPVQFSNLGSPVTVNVPSAPQSRTKSSSCQNILLILSGIVLFVIMIAIIGVLASRLVTGNDKQEKKLRSLETKILDHKRKNNLKNVNHGNQLGNIENELNYMKSVVKDNGPVKVTRLITNTSRIISELEKLQNVISEVHCGVCRRRISKKVVQGYVCDCHELKPSRDCLDFYQRGYRYDGVYKVHQDIGQIISVFCEQSKNGGGWTVFQHRQDGSVNFNRNWTSYVNGFGKLENEHWLGNQNIFTMTSHNDTKGNELRVELEDWEGVKKYATYSLFKIGNAATNFKLDVSGYTGNAGDSLSYSNGTAFSTKDKDNDIHDNAHCGAMHKAGWWYKRCALANLNGEYHKESSDTGIFWKTFKGLKYSLKSCEMKVRRKV